MEYKNRIIIPDSELFKKFIDEEICEVSISLMPDDVCNGYGVHTNLLFRISKEEWRCHNCGYDTLFKNEIWESSHCGRHRYDKYITPIFTYYQSTDRATSSEMNECFEKFLENSNYSNWKMGRGNITPISYDFVHRRR